ncbi:MAG: threonine aldolase [Deltaproteobacteria bacterium]|nr:MAG: threonine aldolase [Deltaproteobacteria bacterium]
MKVDLRSDTVTRPTAEMLEAMSRAEVGDDVMGEDPTINVLEQKVAALFGHEAGLFCPSGTMTNQLGIKVHTRPGDEVVCARASHIYNYEGGGIAMNSGASVRLLEGDRGRFTADEVLANINPDDPHCPRTSLVAVEDTCNRGGGAVWSREDLAALREATKQRGLKFHLDGARAWNRLVATGEDWLAYGSMFDSISLCLSKGLGAPVGSVLIGDNDFIYWARRFRKALGGGMRQAGYLAAAGLYALENHVERLADDHRRAKALEEALLTTAKVSHVLPVETNIVIFELAEGVAASDISAQFKEHDILANPASPRHVRFVTHLQFSDDQLQHTCDTLPKVLS